MADFSLTDPCILFPMRREAQGFLKEYRPQQAVRSAPCWAYWCGTQGRSVLVLQTGIGQTRTATALSWVLRLPVLGSGLYRPRLVLSAGFAGALQEGLQLGDLILATEVTNPEGRSWLTAWPGELPDRRWPRPLHRGRLFSARALITSPEEKRTLGQKYQAVAVDMETAIVAQICAQHRVPFGSLRVISDNVHEALSPRLVSLFSGGRVSPLRVLFALIRSPSLAAELITLAKQTRFAAAQLGQVLSELLTRTPP